MTDCLWGDDEGITIEWSGLEFASVHDRGESPQWGLEETDWWHGGTEDPDLIRAPRGVWAGTDHFASRTVSWSGLLECEDRDMLLEEMRVLQSARGTSLRVWEEDLGRQAVCRKEQALVTPISDRFATYSVTVSLDDPLVSSIDELPVSPERMVRNEGSVRARPVVTVTGATGRPWVSIGEWSVRPPREITASETFIVDCRTESMYLGNSAVFPILPSYPSIRPGATTRIAVSAGTGTVDGVSAWI